VFCLCGKWGESEKKNSTETLATRAKIGQKLKNIVLQKLIYYVVAAMIPDP